MLGNVKNLKGTVTENVTEVVDIKKKQEIENFNYLIILLYIYSLFTMFKQPSMLIFSYSALFSKRKKTITHGYCLKLMKRFE